MIQSTPRDASSTIAVIDYKMGNFGSILNMFRKIGADSVLTADPRDIERAGKLVLPGVGSFDEGMKRLRSLGLIPLLTEKVIGRGTPILGICLGMQLFTKGSEEGDSDGLGWIDGRCAQFQNHRDPLGLRIPHMGWNSLRVHKRHPVLNMLEDDARYYFVHSYYVKCSNEDDVLATTLYGIEFTSALSRGSIIGMQFHPEKSLRWGMNVLRKFVENA